MASLVVTSNLASTQAKQIKRFFSTALELSDRHNGENILDYALKMSRSFNIIATNFILFESFILRIARTNRMTLPIVTQILVNYYNQGASLNLNRCQKLIQDTIFNAFPLGHSAEVSWSLFLARELKITLDLSVIEPLTKSDNSVYALLCLDMEQRGLIDGDLDKSYWQSLLTTNSLWQSSWLLSYEADLKGWLGKHLFTGHVEANPWFRVLKSKRVSFYDPARTVPSFEASALLQKARSKRRSAFEKLLFGSAISPYWPENF